MATTYYAWDPEFDCITDEMDESGNVIASYTQEPKPFGGLISQHRNGVTSFYHYDGVGTTRAMTDENQNITDTAVYTAFGEKTASTGTTVNPFGYVGQVGYLTGAFSRPTYARLRNFSIIHSVWMSVDPSQDDITQSPYVYCGNRPTLFVDPEGDVKRKTELVSQQPRGGSTSGDLQIQIITRKKLKMGECGDFSWTIQWKLGESHRFNLSRGGYFVQHIRTSVMVVPCENPKAFKKSGVEFWEAWDTNPDQLVTVRAQYNNPNDDTFAYREGLDNTWGTITFLGEYGFVTGTIPRPPFVYAGCRDLGAGQLPCSRTDPQLNIRPKDTNGKLRKHMVKVKWNCCDC